MNNKLRASLSFVTNTKWIKYSLVYTADSIRKFDSKSNRTADSIRDSIRTQKNDSLVPIFYY